MLLRFREKGQGAEGFGLLVLGRAYGRTVFYPRGSICTAIIESRSPKP